MCETSAIDCTACGNESGVVYYLYSPNNENQCLQLCPDGYYGQKSNNTCLKCDSRCELCTGPSNSTCSVCKTDSNSVMHYLVYGSSICSDTCPPGQFADSSSFKCLLCDSNCDTCVDTSKKCTSCNLTSSGSKVFL